MPKAAIRRDEPEPVAAAIGELATCLRVVCTVLRRLVPGAETDELERVCEKRLRTVEVLLGEEHVS
jgi:hypothetical protein